MSLNDLEHLLNQLDGFPLLPIGAGTEGKAPIDNDTGEALKDWPSKQFTPEQILGFNGKTIAVGTQTGPFAGYLLIVDIDGKTAVERCITAGAKAKSAGWIIRRDTDKHRLKVAFYIPPELRPLLTDANGEPVGKVVLPTKAPVYDLDADGNPKRDEDGHLVKLAKQEALELFYGTGQCIVLGKHKPSGGNYTWDGSPIQLAAPDDAWLALIKEILATRTAPATRKHAKGSGDTQQSGPHHACRICGRNTSSACTEYTDGERVRINCFEGQTFQPPAGLKEGDTIAISGITWAFTGHGFNPSIGGFSTFVEHIERPKPSEPVAQPAGAAQGDDEPDDDDELRREALERFRQAQQSSIDLNDVFGPLWGQLLIDRAAAFPCDPTVMLLPMLGYISSLIGTKVHVKVKQGWKEPMVVWGYIAQPPSSMKSPAGGVFGGPLAALQAQAIQNHAREFDGFKSREKRWKSECQRLETEAKKKGSQSADLPDPPETPTPARHYYIETITLERVASIHAQSNVVGLLAFHDELSDWFASLEKKAAQTDRPRWLKLWTGQAIKHDTQTSLSAFTDKTAISIVGFIQPDKLADLYQNESHQDTSSAGDGLWSRFLPVIPRTIPFKFNYLEVDLTEDLLHLARQLDDIKPGTLLSIPPHVIDNALQPAWERWAAMEGETSGARAAFIGKLRGYSVRFAGLLHLLNSNLGDIDPTTAQTAVNLCEFFLAQFDQISPQISSHEDVDTPTARFLQKVKDKDADCVRVRDLQRWKLLGKQASSKQCHDFLHSLAAQGIGSFKQVHAKGSVKGAWEWRH